MVQSGTTMCRRLLLTMLLLMGLLMGSAYGRDEIYVAGNPDAYPLEGRVEGVWIGLMPELYTELSTLTGLGFSYLPVTDEERLQYIADEQVEIISCLSRSEGEAIAAVYDLTLSAPIFDYEGESYHIGYTALASADLRAQLDTAIRSLDSAAITAFAMQAAADGRTESLPLWVWTLIVVVCVSFLAALMAAIHAERRLFRLSRKLERSRVIEDAKSFEDYSMQLRHMQQTGSDAMHYMVYVELDNSVVQWYGGESMVFESMMTAQTLIRSKLQKDEILVQEPPDRFLLGLRIAREEEAEPRLLALVEFVRAELRRTYKATEIPVVATAVPVSRLDDSPEAIVRALRYATQSVREKNLTHMICDKAMIQRLHSDIALGRELLERSDLTDFVIHLQPTIAAGSGAITGAQALVRWDHPAKGLLQPSSFLHYFESSGKIRELNYWVFDCLCRWIGEQAPAVVSGKCISFTMTQANLLDSAFQERMGSILAERRVSNKLLAVEIRADVIAEGSAVLHQNLAFLQRHQIALVLVGFGGRGSYIPGLADHTISRVKLDSGFLNRTDSPGGRALLGSVVELVHSLGLDVSCDMVETQDTADLLTKLGVDQLSGYYYYRPMPTEEFVRLL